jgi:hypothetical protein
VHALFSSTPRVIGPRVIGQSQTSLHMELGSLTAASAVVGCYCLAVGNWRGTFITPQHTVLIFPPPAIKAGELSVRTSDGLVLLAWLVPSSDEANPVVLYLLGIARPHRSSHAATRTTEPLRPTEPIWLGILLLGIMVLEAIQVYQRSQPLRRCASGLRRTSGAWRNGEANRVVGRIAWLRCRRPVGD